MQINCNIPISEGSIFNFNKHAFDALDISEDHAKEQLRTYAVAHADEIGINSVPGADPAE